MGVAKRTPFCKPNCKPPTRHSTAAGTTNKHHQRKNGEQEHRLSYCAARTGMRILELENRCAGNRTVGSNSTLSAKILFFCKRIRDRYGPRAENPGFRKNHAKGLCATGSFVGMSEATSYSRSALFSGATIPVVARFSIGGGDPDAPDAGKGPHGMGLEFRLADGSKQHMTMINSPVFFAIVPKTFLDNLIAAKPDPATGKPDPAALKEFATTHPDASAMTKFFADHNPPPSYANSAFFGIHTFKFIDKDNKTTLVKWRFVPADGEKELTDAQLASMPRDFLQQADRSRQAGTGEVGYVGDSWRAGRSGDRPNGALACRPERIQDWHANLHGCDAAGGRRMQGHQL